MLKKILCASLLSLYCITTYAEVLVAALGCGAEGKNRFVLLYKASETNSLYSRVCKDEIGNETINPFTCYRQINVKANSIEVGTRPWDIVIKRKSLETTFYKDSREYACTKSKDPESIENFLRNSKQEQLNKNQI